LAWRKAIPIIIICFNNNLKLLPALTQT
jgi:hypothetical protein